MQTPYKGIIRILVKELSFTGFYKAYSVQNVGLLLIFAYFGGESPAILGYLAFRYGSDTAEANKLEHGKSTV